MGNGFQCGKLVGNITLTKAVDRVLWKEWDPFGVCNVSDFIDDEY